MQEYEEVAPPTVRRLFVGDDGLRAGWSVLLFVVLLNAFGWLLGWVLSHVYPMAKSEAVTSLTPMGTVERDGVAAGALLVSAWVMSVVERRSFRRYGTPVRRMVPDFGMGLLWGFLLLSGLVGVLVGTHHLAWEGAVLRGGVAWGYAGKWAVAFLCVAVSEEYLVRGYLQYTVARGVSGMARAMSVGSRHTYAIGFWVAAILFSVVLFAAGHLGNGGETVAGLLAVSLAGLVFVFSLWRTASLWWAIGFHTAWDWGQTFFYGTPDSGLRGVGHLFGTHAVGRAALSGGSDGPEGSLFALPTLLLALGVIHWTLPYRPRFLTPDQRVPDGTESAG